MKLKIEIDLENDAFQDPANLYKQFDAIANWMHSVFYNNETFDGYHSATRTDTVSKAEVTE